jgi:competence protein ComEC
MSSRVGKWGVWLIVTTIVVWLTALPLVLYQFHVLSPIAIPISPPVWIVIFVAMWSGFLLLVVGWMWSPLAMFLGAVCNYSLAVLEWVVELAEAVPIGHSWWPGPGWWWAAGFYVGLVAVMVWGRALVASRWQVAALSAWILVGLAPPLVRSMTRDRVEVSFLSVGHGTCVVIEGPRGETLLYDAGSLGSPDYATQTIASYLWHRGIRRIDGLVLSHADIDHYNAVPGLLERFRVSKVYVSPVMFSRFGPDASSFGPTVLREAIEHAGVEIREIWSGDRLRVGSDISIDVLHPPRRGVVGTDNANSITLAVECSGRRVLLPGDLESPGIEEVTAELPYRCDVLLAPHHGSVRSDPPGFAAWCMPRWVVISGSGDDEVEPVVQTYARTGARVFHTHERGTVEFTLDSRAIELATWLSSVSLRSNTGR